MISVSAPFPLCLPSPDVWPGILLAAMFAASQEVGVRSELACTHCVLASKSLLEKKEENQLVAAWLSLPGNSCESRLPNIFGFFP